MGGINSTERDFSRSTSAPPRNIASNYKRLVTDDPFFDKVRSERKVQFNGNNNSRGDLRSSHESNHFVSSSVAASSVSTAVDYETEAKKSKKESNSTKLQKLKQKQKTSTKKKEKDIDLTNTMLGSSAAAMSVSGVHRRGSVPSYMTERRNHPTGSSGPATSGAGAGNSGGNSGGSGHSGLHDELHFPRAVGIDTTEIEVEAEGRVKSLQLRLQGQLQTIRSLEAQLGDALQLVEARNKQLAHCNARLKAQASALPASSTNGSGGTGAGGSSLTSKSDTAAAKASELAEQYKVPTCRHYFIIVFPHPSQHRIRFLYVGILLANALSPALLPA
jgi:uncharacterized coiled-coil protein SlyX